ncbi:hypothetical protein HCH_03895 [Hahella chejuensis KCTC 2396]|uniref:Uncharacterized protein n=1 Tax=Hahella chejuensis (strain KCTC 2396) TaxID=349521 RepID=Q2SFF3_HAHCH|nr:hypothetical protein HCH_03895 [Hahella chejuensis KCTC 2396]
MGEFQLLITTILLTYLVEAANRFAASGKVLIKGLFLSMGGSSMGVSE